MASTVQDHPKMPSEVTRRVSPFDQFATQASRFVSRAWFFTICVLLVVVWVPSYFLFSDLNTWQLIINTATTIITFLLVALLQNTQTRSDEAIQQKLNAIADGLADLMAALGEDKPGLRQDLVELRDAVGLEERESS
jgi:Flp pilus assembly protein TadB